MANFEPRGVYTALVTPFTDDGEKVDVAAFEALVAAQIDAGVSGLVPCGTTGETPTLTEDEQRLVIERTAAIVRGRIPVVAGTGTNNTKSSITRSLAALRAGADAVMITMPYYNKPSQAGMVRHVELIAQAVSAPIILYNIPGRCGVELSVESTLEILERCPNVVGIKDATGGLSYCQGLLRQAGDRVSLLCGDDPLTLPMMSVGAKGVISVTSNLYPREVAEVVEDALAGRWEQARKKHLALVPVHRILFIEPSPQPIKAALALKGVSRAVVRPPLIEAAPETRQALAQVFQEYESRRT
ncbi:MAG TPA: 4-hydroxy-tetrahydrodipicolinate synthase [Polyangiaceae bacterium]|nr:4-hydroxy-tetrahydrodipicolinate synthase [Polyangiaceae bacterium]